MGFGEEIAAARPVGAAFAVTATCVASVNFNFVGAAIAAAFRKAISGQQLGAHSYAVICAPMGQSGPMLLIDRFIGQPAMRGLNGFAVQFRPE